MTAPAIAQAPVVQAPVVPVVVEQTPVAPVVPVEQAPVVEDAPIGLQAMMDKVIRRPVPSDEPTDPNAPPVVPVEGAPVVDPNAPPVEATPVVMVSEIKEDDGDGEIVLRARDPKTGQFSEMDQTRTYELSRRDKATGEVRVYNKTLPEVLRLANDGLGMQKARDELSHYRQHVPQWQQAHANQQQEIDGLRAIALELLTADEGVVIDRRNAYLAEQAPEKILARRQQDLDARESRLRQDETRRQQAAQQQEIGQHAQALASRIGSVVQDVVGLVGQEAAAGKIALETASMMTNGRIPPERFRELEQYVQGPYLAWAKSEAAKRTTATTTAADLERQRQQTLDIQRKAQLAAQQAGAASRPMGGMGGGAQPAAKKPVGVQATIDAIVRRPLAAAG